MKYFLFTLLAAFGALCSACSNTSGTNSGSTDKCALVPNHEKKNSFFVVDGFDSSNFLVDFDIRIYPEIAPTDSTSAIQFHYTDHDGSYQFAAYSGFQNLVKVGKQAGRAKLAVYLSTMESGEYEWKGFSSYLGFYGVYFAFPTEEYWPVEGHTLIHFSTTKNKDGLPDTVYGSFCGVMRSQQTGKLLTVRDGKFYGVFP